MKFPLLLDTYGAMLTDRKREILDYYYNEDYSLSEISELTGISRQGVRDSIKKSEEEIHEWEAKLKIVEMNEKRALFYAALANEMKDISASLEGVNKERLEKVIDAIISSQKTE